MNEIVIRRAIEPVAKSQEEQQVEMYTGVVDAGESKR